MAGNIADFSLTFWFVLITRDAVELSPLVGAFRALGPAAVPAAVFTAFAIYSLLALAAYLYATSERVRARLLQRRHCRAHPRLCGAWAFSSPLIALVLVKWVVVVSDAITSAIILLFGPIPPG